MDYTPPDEKISRELLCVTRAYKTLGAGNRTVLRATDEQQLLRDMCNVIVGIGSYRMAFIVYAEHDEAKTTRWMYGVGPAIERVEAFPFTWTEGGEGGTVTGSAIRTGVPVVGRSFPETVSAATPAYQRFLLKAIEDGYGSVSAFPLKVEGAVIGALVIAAEEVDAFNAHEVELLNELADDLAYGIAHLRMSEREREASAAVRQLAYFDGITGLPNRLHMLEAMHEAIAAAKQQQRTLALLHLEVSSLHEINKVLGYQAGDALLRELRDRLAREVQPDELLARVGEAEFALLLPQGGTAHAVSVAQRLLDALRAPVAIGELRVEARAEVGVALFPEHAADADTLLRRANAVMHLVKPIRGGYAVYAEGQEAEHTRRLALMGDLHRAIGCSELRLYCQPKVDIRTRRVCGAEALVRWQHPQLGMMSTIEFVQLAESAGMIAPLTNWMLEAAFRQSHAWRVAGQARPLAVNLSAHDLYDVALIERIRSLLAIWDVPPELIQFELTESALMTDPAAAINTLHGLKRLNVKLFIDDYGTGYSSLSYLQKMPVDAIKIDQSFVGAMTANRDAAVIISSTIDLGHKLGMEVVAEGVETAEAWNCLAELGCDVAQGYLISRPMPAGQLEQWQRGWA